MDEVLFLLFRASSVFLVETSYVPDEYWQSLEVAHNMVFGYGYVTWEWKHGLRSYLYPSVFAILYKFLAVVGWDTPRALTLAPRFAQAALTAVSDACFHRLCLRLGCKSFWSKLIIFTNGFWYYCASRTIANMFEMSLTTIALYYYPWVMLRAGFLKSEKCITAEWVSIERQSVIYISLAILNCIVRPTAVTIWAPLVLYHLLKSYPEKLANLVARIILPAGLALLALSLVVDCSLYGKLVFPPFNFFVFNIFSGLSSFYGSHPFHWYITQGIPVVLGLHFVLFACAVCTVLRDSVKKSKDHLERIQELLLAIIVINILVFSTISHKEFRFILPLLPMMEIMAIRYASKSKRLNSRGCSSAVLVVLLVASFLAYAVLLGSFHQRGSLAVMGYLSREAEKKPTECSYLFLTPCHSTPLYSHLHVNVPVRFITCEPPLSAAVVDESEEFFRDPRRWLESHWHALNEPTHVVCFDTVVRAVDDFLRGKGLFLSQNFTHTIFRGSSAGDHILVYERMTGAVPQESRPWHVDHHHHHGGLHSGEVCGDE